MINSINLIPVSDQQRSSVRFSIHIFESPLPEAVNVSEPLNGKLYWARFVQHEINSTIKGEVSACWLADRIVTCLLHLCLSTLCDKLPSADKKRRGILDVLHCFLFCCWGVFADLIRRIRCIVFLGCRTTNIPGTLRLPRPPGNGLCSKCAIQNWTEPHCLTGTKMKCTVFLLF